MCPKPDWLELVIKFAKSIKECVLYRSLIDVVIPNICSILADKWIIPIESKPILKRSSSMLILLLLEIFEIISKTFFSISFFGSTTFLSTSKVTASNAFLSILPFGVCGSFSIFTKWLGIIYVGRLFSKCAFKSFIFISSEDV